MYATEQQAAILRAAVAAIKAHPETFDMSQWARHSSRCGSVCCLAGQVVRNNSTVEQWVEWLHRQELDQSTRDVKAWTFPVRREAERLLGLSESLTDVLFDHNDWPPQFLTETVMADDEEDSGWGEEYLLPTVKQLEARVEWWIEHGE
jgi:hypothetical protein